MKKSYFSMGILCLFVSSVLAQSKQKLEASVDITQAHYIGKTLPLKDLVKWENKSPFPKRQKSKELKGKTIPNFFHGEKFIKTRENTLPKNVDPALQTEILHLKTPNAEPRINIDGMDENISTVKPPDPVGDIGKDHYIQAVNSTYFQIFDKDGNDVGGGPINANTLWSSLGYQSAGDPIVLYDQQAQRWIFTEFPSSNFLLFAISESSDPLGSWDAYSFATPNFPDYPKYSIWNNEYVVTTNEGGTSEQPVYLINRSDILNLEPNPKIQRVSFNGVSGAPELQAAAPVDWTGNTPPPIDALPTVIRFNDDEFGASEDRLELIEIEVDWENEQNTQVTQINVPTLPFESLPCSESGSMNACVPQLGGAGMSGVEYFVTNQVHYRNFGSYESMVCCFLVDVTAGSNVAGIRWVEFRRTLDDWYIYQEGTYGANDGIHRFMGSICIDAFGNIALGYCISGESIYPGLAYTGRKKSDPLGEMSIPEYILIDGLSSNPIDRYGDYASMTVDPIDGKTFWYTSEYMKENSKWGTRIVSFEIQSDTTDIAPISLVGPQNSSELGASEQIIIEVKNFGLDTPTTFNVGYIFENGSPIVESVNYTLYPDSIYTHTFSSTVNMENEGMYAFNVFTSLEGDSVFINDTLFTNVSHLQHHDAGITSVSKEQEGVSCGSSSEISVSIQNFGGDTLFSVELTIQVNGNITDIFSIPFNEGLVFGESESINLYVSGLQNGSNNVKLYTSYPNNEQDLNNVNDTSNLIIQTNLNGSKVSLEITTDYFAEDTSWDLQDSDNNVVYTGGNYASSSVNTEQWCLVEGACYTFNIYDSYGDGICCFYGNGTYNITDQSGEVITSMLTTNWTSSESNYFCLDSSSCTLLADLDASVTSSLDTNDGAIMITAQNGTPPYHYSIDNGSNFSSNPMFTGLFSGLYNVVVKDANSCEYVQTLQVPFCNVVANLEIQNTSTEQSTDGIIIVHVSSNTVAPQYSIDGGNTFVSTNVFLDLSVGTYEILVQDSLGCTTSLIGEVDFSTGIDKRSIEYASEIMITPNPTKDVVQVFVPDHNKTKTYINVEVLNEEGQRLYSSNLTKYNEGYTGQLTLFHLPSGVYYIRFLDGDIQRMMKVIKN